MKLDTYTRLNKYSCLSKYSEMILDFIIKAREEKLYAGEYLLDDTRLYAIIQKYSTRDSENCRMEVHKKYADVQYKMNGEECRICWKQSPSTFARIAKSKVKDGMAICQTKISRTIKKLF